MSQFADTEVQGKIMKKNNVVGILAMLALGAFFCVLTVIFNMAYTAQLREIFK